MQVLFQAIIVHVLFLLAAFDIHFTSPIVRDIKGGEHVHTGPAKRLVLFVADGLRFDTFWKTNGLQLHQISKERGIWGRSSTRVPTESRTGHVAVVAGLYEDPSAVFKGWKENPVDFDSVFNRSRYTWSWGSPDILRIFAKGFNSDHVFTDSYSPEDEDFTGTDAYKFDQWVFEKFGSFLLKAQKDENLEKMVKQDKIVFFLHLLGLDTNGHAKKPHSREYEENLRYVDKMVAEAEQAISNFYGDNATAFLLTSDHGMTDWGSHGAGDPSETDTPFVAWGAGVYNPPVPAVDLQSCRRDCNQGDLTPLVAALLGIDVPVNSMGFLRVDHLSDDLKFRAEAMLANSDQMFRQFHTLEEKKEGQTFSMIFQPYKPLADSHFAVKDIQNLIDRGFYSEAITAAEELHQICSSGIEYYQRYDRPWLYFVATLGFLGWIAYTICCLLGIDAGTRTDKRVVVLFSAVGCVLSLYLIFERAPVQYIVYSAVPIVTWGYVLSKFPNIRSVNSVQLTLQSILGVIFGTNLLVLSFFHRWCLSLILLGASALPFLTKSGKRLPQKVFWTASCMVLSIMPMLPVVGREKRLELVYLGCALVLPVAFVAYLFLKKKKNLKKRSEKVLLVQLLFVALSCLVKWHAFNSVDSGRGLPLLDQIFSWTMLVQSFVSPLLVETSSWTRLLSLFLGLLPAFILLSMSHEVIFYGTFSIVLCSWILLDGLPTRKVKDLSETANNNKLMLSSDDLRIAFLYLFFTIMSFFGLGNVASVNSFDPSASFCFVATFSPVIVMVILLWKILVPFLLVGCAVTAVEKHSKIQPNNILLLNLIFSDLMTLHFFYLVTNTGSWLEIGTSISHFVIVELTVVFLLVLKVLSIFLLEFKL